MNQNATPPNDGDNPDEQAPQSTEASLDNNTYVDSVRRRDAEQLNLDASAPHLEEHDERRLNRKALGLLASIAILLAGIITWVLHTSHSETIRSAPRDEVLSVTNAPEAQFKRQSAQPNDSLPPMIPANTPASPIPLRATASKVRERLRRAEPETPRPPSLLERRIAGGRMVTAIAEGVSGASETQPPYPPYLLDPTSQRADPRMSATDNLAYTAKELADVSSAAPLAHPDTLMPRGTYIRCVLETRIITDTPGFTSCVVHEPVYSFTGKRLLLPKGSKVQGKYAMEPNGPRVAVIWDRIVTPTGIDVNMASPGVDSLGGSGHPGHYSAHWGSRIGSALMLSLFSDAFKYAAAEYGPVQTTVSNGIVTQSPFESNTASTIQSLAQSALSRGANRPATVTINQGSVIAIYVAKDVDFSGVVSRY